MTLTTSEITTALGYAKYGSPKYLYDLVKDQEDRKVAVAVTDAATYSVLNADNGRLHICPDFTASCTATLPVGVAGMRYRFVFKGVAADAQNFVLQTAASGVLFRGGVGFVDTDTDVVATVYPDNSDDRILTVVTPGGGSFVEVYFDGTAWLCTGYVNSNTTPAFT